MYFVVIVLAVGTEMMIPMSKDVLEMSASKGLISHGWLATYSPTKTNVSMAECYAQLKSASLLASYDREYSSGLNGKYRFE